MLLLKRSTMMLLCFVIFGGSTFAQTYVIGVEKLDYYPHYTNRSGQYEGWARDLFDLFAEEQGYQFKYEILPVERLFERFLDKTLDFKYPDSSFWRQDLKKGIEVIYSKEVVAYIDGVMVLPEKEGVGVQSLKKLGTVRGFTPWDYLDLIQTKKIQVKESNHFVGLLEKTILKRIDGAYINVDVAKHHLKASLKQPYALVFDKNLPHTIGSYFLSTIKHAMILQEFNDFLKKERKQINGLKQKYGLSLD